MKVFFVDLINQKDKKIMSVTPINIYFVNER